MSDKLQKSPLAVVFNIVLAVALVLFLISAAVVFTLNFRPLYYFDVDHLNIIAVHDAARPFITPEEIETVCADAEKYGAATLAVPVKDTIKVAAADGTVCATPERSTLRAIQTPQVFRLSLYKEALCLAKNAGKQYTDDCQLIEAAGGKVYLTPGDYKNIKITTPEDLLVAEAFAAEK